MIRIKNIDNHYYGNENTKDNWDIKLLDGNFVENSTVTVELDSKTYKRKVYYGNGDLYITINGYRYYLSDII